MNDVPPSLSSSLLAWIRSFDTASPTPDLASLSDGVTIWHILQAIDPEYFTDEGGLPEPDVNSSSDWTRTWQNLKHISKQLELYYRDVCDVEAPSSGGEGGYAVDLKAIAAGDGGEQGMERLIMHIIRAAMSSPVSNQRMAQRLMGLGRERAMVIAGELRNMEVEAEELAQYADSRTESSPPSRAESTYHSEADLEAGDTPTKAKTNGDAKHPVDGEERGMYATDPLLEREEELLQAQSTISRLESHQLSLQRAFASLRADKETLQEAFDAYRSEIEHKTGSGRHKTSGAGGSNGDDVDVFAKLQRQTENDRAYIDDLEAQLQSSRGFVENYEWQIRKLKEDGGGQKLRDDLQMLKTENVELTAQVRASENLKKKIQSLQDSQKGYETTKEELKMANEKLEELARLQNVRASLEKEVLEKKGLIRNQEYQINELGTMRRHAEHDNRVLATKLAEAREKHEKDFEALEALRSQLGDVDPNSSYDEAGGKATSAQDAEDDESRREKAAALPKEAGDGGAHLREQVQMLESQLSSADVRLKQAAERAATLEDEARAASAAQQGIKKDLAAQYESQLAALRNQLVAAQKSAAGTNGRGTQKKTESQLEKENRLMGAAWVELAGRLTLNGVSLDRRQGREVEKRSWIGQQRSVVGPGAGRGSR